MIIFDLETLANCDHRRHFVDPIKNPELEYANYFKGDSCNFPRWQYKETGKRFKPDYHAFYEACDQDLPIKETIEVLWALQKSHCTQDLQCWSGRCESVREKTLKWFDKYIDPAKYWNWDKRLKMRPLGDSTADDVLKEKWLDEHLEIINGKRHCRNEGCNHYKCSTPIDFVFDDRPKVVRMWRRRGIFVFNCCQHDKEF